MLLDTNNSIFLPSIGGTTLYLFGDPAAITDPDREVACRPHDECNGSDVFGTDICTCRPYLAYVSDACCACSRCHAYFAGLELTHLLPIPSGYSRRRRDSPARRVWNRCLLPQGGTRTG